MKHKQFIYLTFILSILTVFAACNGKKKKEIDPRVMQMSKSWVYHKIDIEGTVFPGEQMGSPRMDFSLDSSYKMTFNSLVDSGKWYFVGDTLVTTTFSNPDVEEYLTVKSLTDTMVVLLGESNGKELILTMKTLEEK